MNPYNDALMEDLIDYNAEDTITLPHSSWTEQALDLFISILKNVKKDNFSSQRDMLEVITIRMTERSYRFSVDQIERKYNSLKKMYTEKKENNQSVEPELTKLFGDSKANSPVHQQQIEQPLQKKIKLDTSVEDSADAATDDGDEKKILWSTDATRIFLDLLEHFRPQLGSKLRTKKQMWEEICRRLKTHGYNFTYPQVENKWKALLRHYRGRLELMRNGSQSRYGVFSKLKHNYTAWPELFDSTTRKVKFQEHDISFANDQNLPYEDDGYTDDEPYQFEEACLLPDVEIADETDPVMIEDVKPPKTPKSPLKDQPSPSSESEKAPEQDVPPLDKIVKEIAIFREDNRKHQNELLQLKRLELRAYRERTVQFTRIGDGLGELMCYLKRKATDESF